MAAEPRIGTRISKRRQQLGLTQAQLAARLGVNRTSVAHWETGKHYPQRYLGLLESVLGISLGEPPDETYTDPTERSIWEDPSLPEDARRDLIGQLRRERRHARTRRDHPPGLNCS